MAYGGGANPDPATGLAASTTVDPAGAALTTATGYESGGFLRRISRTLPAGNATTYAHYGSPEARTRVAHACAVGGPAAS